MAGTLTLQCAWFVNDFMLAFFFMLGYVGIPAAIGFAPSFIFGAWNKYDQEKMPRFAPHPFFIWAGYPAMYFVTGVLYWITYFYGLEYCEVAIPLFALVALLIPYSIWPLLAFVLGGRWGLLLAALVNALIVLMLAVSLALNIIFFGGLIVIIIIIHIVLAAWFAYMALIWFLASRCDTTLDHFGVVKQFFKTFNIKGAFACPPPTGTGYYPVGQDLAQQELKLH